MQLRTLALALVASSVTIAACGSDDVTGTNANDATVQFINASAVSLDIAQGSSVPRAMARCRTARRRSAS